MYFLLEPAWQHVFVERRAFGRARAEHRQSCAIVGPADLSHPCALDTRSDGRHDEKVTAASHPNTENIVCICGSDHQAFPVRRFGSRQAVNLLGPLLGRRAYVHR